MKLLIRAFFNTYGLNSSAGKIAHGFQLGLCALHLLYYLLLQFSYCKVIVVVYGYMGFVDSFSVTKAFFSFALIFITFTLIPKTKLPSNFFLNMILAMTIIPSLVIFAGSDGPYSFALINLVAFHTLLLVIKCFSIKDLNIKGLYQQQLLNFFAVYGILIFAVILALGGSRYFNIDISKVYEFRREAAANLPGIFGYLMPIFGKVVIPLGITMSLSCRKYHLTLVFILFGFLTFALTAHKLPLFVPFFVIIIWWISLQKNVSHLLVIFLISIILFGFLEIFILNNLNFYTEGLIMNLGVRRTLLVPSWLDRAYFDFFSQNPYVYWSQSKISMGLLDNPYDVTTPILIGREVIGNPATHADTAWIGFGYSNAGVFGVLIYSLLIGAVIKFIDQCSLRLGTPFMITVFSIPIFAMGELPAAFLTHGLGLLIILVAILKPVCLKKAYSIFIKNLEERFKIPYKVAPNYCERRQVCSLANPRTVFKLVNIMIQK